jgi:hypothetical protein
MNVFGAFVIQHHHKILNFLGFRSSEFFQGVTREFIHDVSKDSSLRLQGMEIWDSSTTEGGGMFL